ncbi:MAG TPA: cytochrome c, partial [Polyangiaceae bacterium]|nr:cytochrome c [Polyangiaceae bacterium]
NEAPAEVREWTPADHKAETQNPERTGQTPAATSQAPAGLDEVTIATWSNNCTMCHGQIGRGDGPQAALTKPRDLTDPKWQAQVSDEQIANSIVQGKGMMPKFALPPATVQSLVQLVRRLATIPQAQAAAAAASAAAASAAPSASPPAASAARPSAPATAVPSPASGAKPAPARTPTP